MENMETTTLKIYKHIKYLCIYYHCKYKVEENNLRITYTILTRE